MNAMTMVIPIPSQGIRERIVSHIKEAPDRDTKVLLKDILTYLDKPYDLEWLREEYPLSPAEFRVISLLIEGKTPAVISEITGTQVSTVRNQTHKAYTKMRISNVAELTALLLQRARNP